MSDDWRELREGWERLRWARARRYQTGLEAAESMGMNPDTYRAYERRPDSSKHTKLDHASASRFAKRFRVRWEWLLSGEGEPWSDEDRPAGEYASDPPSPFKRVSDLLGQVSRKEQEEIASMVEALVHVRKQR